MSKPKILTNIATLLEQISQKISNNSIADNLTTTEKGMVLDASQGNVLHDKINGLQSALTHVGSFNIGGDLNTANKLNSYYIIADSTDVVNLPPNLSIGQTNNSVLIVLGQDTGSFTQMYYASNPNMIFTRNYTKWQDPQWSSWKQIATTDQIEVLSTERGYLQPKELTDFKLEVRLSGKYNANNTCKGMPFDGQSWSIDVTTTSTGYGSAIARVIYGARKGEVWTNNLYNNVWGDWQQLATTTKTDILFPFNMGFEDASNTIPDKSSVSKDNLNRGLIYCSVKKTDGGVISGTYINLGLLPQGYKPKKLYSVNAMVFTDTGLVNVVKSTKAYVDTTGNIVLRNIPSADNIKAVEFTLPYDII